MIKIVLLCEDKQTNVFVRQFLSRRKIRGRQVASLFSTGHGAGDQWVRENFPKELQAVRNRQRSFLIVMIDADTGSTQDRRNQLDRECRKQGIAVPTEDDSVLIAVPKRNIETWFAYLRGEVVNEKDRYSKFKKKREKECKPLANKLHTMCHDKQKLRDHAPPSLVETCELYRRLRQP